jgi:N-acetylneuraminate 9-O-acetyltransferase
MTGYGNFHYYYRTKDFRIGRFAQMMWRLNFLVVMCCIVMRNDWMLYYICPMHTVFTMLVYGALATASNLNDSRPWMITKLLACLVGVVVVWDIKRVFYSLWAPLGFLVGYRDPRRPSSDLLHGAHLASSEGDVPFAHHFFCWYPSLHTTTCLRWYPL